MTLYDELVARGLIAQVTDEDVVKELINNGKATFYIGFDPAADSLHVGHFMALCLMKRLQMAGNKPIALVGGGTAMIGDPSGRTDMRQMMSTETINHNVECFKKQMSRFIFEFCGYGYYKAYRKAREIMRKYNGLFMVLEMVKNFETWTLKIITSNGNKTINFNI